LNFGAVLAAFFAVSGSITFAEPRAPSTQETAAKAAYHQFRQAIAGNNRDAAWQMVWIPRDYLRAYASESLDALMERCRFGQAIEQKIRPLVFSERMILVGADLMPEDELKFDQLKDANGAFVAELKVLKQSPIVSPVAWIMPTSNGDKINVINPFDGSEPPSQPSESMQRMIDQQTKVLPPAIARLGELRKRVEAGEFKTIDALVQALVPLSATTAPSN
jgi:hypothetical protein